MNPDIWVDCASARYPIHIQNNLLSQVPTLFPFQGCKVAIVTQDALRPYTRILLDSFSLLGLTPLVIEIQAGESHKTLNTVSGILDQLLEQAFSRQDWVLALGGGVVGDMTGFAAAIALRGLRLLQIPTTLLAQVDAAIGGKTGVNHRKGKNLIGSFYQPKAVLIDPTVLFSLPKRELLCGLAEIVKYAFIRDLDLLEYLHTHAKRLSELEIERDLELWQHLITRSCSNKAQVVSLDEKEASLRETLNFGHTVGHAIETEFDYSRYLHGEAVALGMAAALQLSVLTTGLPQDQFDQALHLLSRLGFDLKLAPCKVENCLAILKHDKKVKDNQVRFVLLSQLGTVSEQHHITQAHLQLVMQHLLEGTYKR